MKSQSPFKIDWSLKSEDPYLNSVKKRFQELSLQTDTARAVEESETAKQVLGQMVTVEE